MPPLLSLRRLGRRAFVPVFALSLGCGDPTVSIAGDVIPGSYQAISFRVTPTGQPMVDVLAAGGSLSVVIATDSSMTGTLVLPAGLLTANATSTSMAGQLRQRSDGTYWFAQNENTFMRELIWQQFTDSFVTTSLLNGVQFQITLKK